MYNIDSQTYYSGIIIIIIITRLPIAKVVLEPSSLMQVQLSPNYALWILSSYLEMRSLKIVNEMLHIQS